MEFILNVEDEPFVKNGEKLYKSTAFASLVFDQKGLNKLERYDRARHEAEKCELTKLRRQVDDLCNEVNRVTSLESKNYGIGFQEGHDTGLKKLHDALKTISVMSYNERTTLFGASSITDILAIYDPFEIIDNVAMFKSDKEDGFKLWHEVEGNTSGIKAIIYGISGDNLSVLYWNPTHTKLVASNWMKSVCTPTGKKCTEMRELLNFV